MSIGLIASTIDHGTSLAKRIFLIQFIVAAMQIFNTGRHHDTIGVVPGACTDSITGIL